MVALLKKLKTLGKNCPVKKTQECTDKKDKTRKTVRLSSAAILQGVQTETKTTGWVSTLPFRSRTFDADDADPPLLNRALT